MTFYDIQEEVVVPTLKDFLNEPAQAFCSEREIISEMKDKTKWFEIWVIRPDWSQPRISSMFVREKFQEVLRECRRQQKKFGQKNISGRMLIVRRGKKNEVLQRLCYVVLEGTKDSIQDLDSGELWNMTIDFSQALFIEDLKGAN